MVVRFLPVVLLLVASTLTRAATLHVGTSKPITTVAEALERCQPHDTIKIHPGNYPEHGLVVAKPITIIGMNGAFIDGEHKGTNLMLIQSDSVEVQGLGFKNVAVSYIDDNAAIKVDRRSHIRIASCMIQNAMFGIYLRSSTYCHLINNIITSTTSTSESNSGNGIHSWYSTHLLIEGNVITGQRDGLYFEFARQTLIRNNVSQKNLRYGLHFMFSDSCTYEHNTFIDNGAGIAVMYTKHVLMAYNRFLDNWGSSTYGLLLKDISNSHLHHNEFRHNSIAIHSEGSTRILFEYNLFKDNGYGLRMLGSCLDNTVRWNAFDGNVFDVTTNSQENTNAYDHNYWSGYEGYDLNKDGIGDVPHHPVRLYALMVEQLPSSTVLLHSALVHVLDLTERIIPTLTPKNLVDRSPLMRPPPTAGVHR